MNQWNSKELQDAIEEVLRRSVLDSAFRSLALSDGRAALSRVTGRELEADLLIKFVDNSGSIKTIPLPEASVTVVEELTEEELEDVAGGGGGGSNPPITGGWSKIGRITF